jgi:hypothetical protein
MPSVPHRRAIGAVLLIVASSAGLWLLLAPGTPPLVEVPSRSAGAFAASIGVNVHTSYSDTSYARSDIIRARLRELGVRHVRDGLVPGRPDELAALRRLHAQGQSITLILLGGASPGALVRVAKRSLPGALAALEGPNELDNQHRAGWAAVLRTFMRGVRAEADAAPRLRVPILAPSLVDPGNGRQIASVAAAWSVANLHTYPAGQPPEGRIDAQVRNAHRAGGGKPVVVTESGYHNALRAETGQPPVSEQAAAVYVPRLLLESFRAGAVRTFLYELADERHDPALLDPEQHFGLLRSDLSAKPAFTALQRLVTAVAAARPATGSRAPAVRTDAAAHGVRAVRLRRGDGSALLALWRPVAVWSVATRRPIIAPTVTVRVRFSRPPREAALLRPSAGAATVRLPPARELSIPVGPDVRIVSYR